MISWDSWEIVRRSRVSGLGAVRRDDVAEFARTVDGAGKVAGAVVAVALSLAVAAYGDDGDTFMTDIDDSCDVRGVVLGSDTASVASVRSAASAARGGDEACAAAGRARGAVTVVLVEERVLERRGGSVEGMVGWK